MKKVLLALVFTVALVLLPQVSLAEESVTAQEEAEVVGSEVKTENAVETIETKNETETDKNEAVKATKKELKEKANARAIERRSIVANAVAEMLKVADREGGIGKQVREIAQNQNKDFDEAEASLEKVQSRSKFAKFFIGQNHKEIKNAQQKIDKITEKVAELNQFKTQTTNADDQVLLDQNIQKLEQVKSELNSLVQESNKGFSLLGWLFRLFA